QAHTFPLGACGEIAMQALWQADDELTAVVGGHRLRDVVTVFVLPFDPERTDFLRHGCDVGGILDLRHTARKIGELDEKGAIVGYDGVGIYQPQIVVEWLSVRSHSGISYSSS